jgi:hypothetical protein
MRTPTLLAEALLAQIETPFGQFSTVAVLFGRTSFFNRGLTVKPLAAPSIRRQGRDRSLAASMQVQGASAAIGAAGADPR